MIGLPSGTATISAAAITNSAVVYRAEHQKPSELPHHRLPISQWPSKETDRSLVALYVRQRQEELEDDLWESQRHKWIRQREKR